MAGALSEIDEEAPRDSEEKDSVFDRDSVGLLFLGCVNFASSYIFHAR